MSQSSSYPWSAPQAPVVGVVLPRPGGAWYATGRCGAPPARGEPGPDSRLEPGGAEPHNAQVIRFILVVSAALMLGGCAAAPVRHPLPPALASQATVPGLPADVRAWGDDPEGPLRDWVALTDDQLAACCSGLMGRPHHYLVISSGGDDGAFGAGLLAGWTAAGTRPEFDLVTGVSTGALMAPLAFLGSDYDDELREVYTLYSADDMVDHRSVLAALSGDAALS